MNPGPGEADVERWCGNAAGATVCAMNVLRRHYSRFGGARIWLTLLGVFATFAAMAVVFSQGDGLIFSPNIGDNPLGSSNPLWLTAALWLVAGVVAFLALAFTVGRSPRRTLAAIVSSLVLGLAGVLLAGYRVNLDYVTAHVWFADPTRRWQVLLLWLVPAAALITAAVLTILDVVTTYPPSDAPPAPTDGAPPGIGNEALHWPGSTIAGVDAQSNARERL